MRVKGGGKLTRFEVQRWLTFKWGEWQLRVRVRVRVRVRARARLVRISSDRFARLLISLRNERSAALCGSAQICCEELAARVEWKESLADRTSAQPSSLTPPDCDIHARFLVCLNPKPKTPKPNP